MFSRCYRLKLRFSEEDCSLFMSIITRSFTSIHADVSVGNKSFFHGLKLHLTLVKFTVVGAAMHIGRTQIERGVVFHCYGATCQSVFFINSCLLQVM